MSSYEVCTHGKCTTYPGFQRCIECEKHLERMLKKAKKGSATYHALRYAVVNIPNFTIRLTTS